MSDALRLRSTALVALLLGPCALAAAPGCADESPLADGAASREDLALAALEAAFDADDCATVESLAAGFVASTDLRLHAVTTAYGRCLWRAGAAVDAAAVLGRVAYVEPADAYVPTALFWLARARLDADDPTAALGDLDRFGARFAHHMYADDARYWHGQARLALGDATGAIDDFAAVLALSDAPDSLRADATYATGLALVERAGGDPASPDLEAAFTWFQRVRDDFATSIRVDNAAYHQGWVRFDQGRFADCERLMVDALALYPASSERPSMAYLLGRARYEQGELGPALEAFVITLAFPSATYYDNALYYSARAWYRMATPDEPNKYTQAIQLFDRLLAERPDSSYADDAAYFRARAYLELGDLPAADLAFARVPADYPMSPYVDNAWRYLVTVRLALGDCAGAKAALDALAALTPPSSYLPSSQAAWAASACAAETP